MAGSAGSGPMEQINSLEGHAGIVNSVVYVSDQDAIISISDDKTLRVWVKRDTGMYWPSIWQTLESPGTALSYDTETRNLYVGLHIGHVLEYSISEDFNKLTGPTRDIPAHKARVTDVVHSAKDKWIMSCGRDKCFQFYNSDSGRRLGFWEGQSWLTSIVYDSETKHAFVGEFNGTITLLQLSEGNVKELSTLTGHTGSVRGLAWDPKRQLLFSGSFDTSAMIWDIGGKKGVTYDLSAHSKKIKALVYVENGNKLLTSGDDQKVICWDIGADRIETPHWNESDTCELCGTPFFWNVAVKLNANRQHHCRHCGKALCDKCCSQRTRIPKMGFELDVRVCGECFTGMRSESSSEDMKPLAKVYHAKHQVMKMWWDEETKQLITCGRDRLIKIWKFKG
eukprot:Nk52_evm20s78 gene=Nk52_evmTU20s78